MARNPASFSHFTRAAWLLLAVCVMVLCGPVRKLAGLDTLASAKTVSTSFKKSKSFSGEKRDLPRHIIKLVKHVPFAGDVMLPASYTITSGPVRNMGLSVTTGITGSIFAVTGQLPLYLRQCRLQV